MFCLMPFLIMRLTFTAVLQLGQEEVKKKKILVEMPFHSNMVHLSQVTA